MSIVDNLQVHRFFPIFFIFLTSTAWAAPVWQQTIAQDLCQQWQDIAQISRECQLSFPGLSSQYALPACNEAWQTKLLRPLSLGRNGLEISCSAPRWQQNFAVHLHIFADVAVLASSANIGQRLAASDISYSRTDISTLTKDFYTPADAIVGLQLKRTLKAGTVLNSDMLDAPLLIERGDLITVQTLRPGLQIKIQGTALERGRLGQVIRVRNNQSNKVIAAKVVAAGVVQVK